MAICCVSEKIQTAYVCLNTLRALDFFASLHLTIFEQAVFFEFFNNQLRGMATSAHRRTCSIQEESSPIIHLEILMDSRLRGNDVIAGCQTFSRPKPRQSGSGRFGSGPPTV